MSLELLLLESSQRTWDVSRANRVFIPDSLPITPGSAKTHNTSQPTSALISWINILIFFFMNLLSNVNLTEFGS